MSDKRKKYSPTEKAKIPLDAIKSELTLAQITTKYGVHPTQVNTWKKQALAYLPDAFSDKNKQEATTYEMQLAELYEQIGRLKTARNSLGIRASRLAISCSWATHKQTRTGT